MALYDTGKMTLYDTGKINQFEKQLNQMKCQLQQIDLEEQKLKVEDESAMLIQQETTQKNTFHNQSETWSSEGKPPSITRKHRRRQQLLDHIFKDTSNVSDRRLPYDDKTELSILDSMDNTNEIQK